ncbi:hypothetical protein VT84_12250 [Gemmata sp. SH-PL17]|nr:hypothetical protein VT84_12250 [Gemmata sp. SH-PL17]
MVPSVGSSTLGKHSATLGTSGHERAGRCEARTTGAFGHRFEEPFVSGEDGREMGSGVQAASRTETRYTLPLRSVDRWNATVRPSGRAKCRSM